MEKITKIEQGQFAALKKRLASGRPLTASQMAFVERYDHATRKTPAQASQTSQQAFPRWRDGLASPGRAFRMARGRADAPKSFSVSAWRDYLITHGKGATIERVESSVTVQRDSYREIFGDGLLAGFGYGCDDIGKFLEVALEAADVVTTPAQRDRAAISIWLCGAYGVHRVAMKHGMPGLAIDSD